MTREEAKEILKQYADDFCEDVPDYDVMHEAIHIVIQALE